MRSAARTRSSSSPPGCRSRTRASVPPKSATSPTGSTPASRATPRTSSRTPTPGATPDFLASLNLWRYLREQQRELSGNQFRKRCHAEYLHYLRVREWQDLVGQVRSAAREVGVKLNQTEADPQQIHVALLSGLLSH